MTLIMRLYDVFIGIEEWTAGSRSGPEQVQYDQLDKAIAVAQTGDSAVYYYLPKRFLGDWRFAYNQMFSFTMRQTLDSSAVSSRFVLFKFTEIVG